MFTFNLMLFHSKFPLKVWLTSVLISPLLMIASMKLLRTESFDDVFNGLYLLTYFLSVVIGGFVSIPCFLFLWLCYTLLVKGNTPIWLLRMILALVSTICCLTIFILMSLPDLKNFWSKANIFLIGSYCLPLLVGVFIFKVSAVKTQSKVIEI